MKSGDEHVSWLLRWGSLPQLAAEVSWLLRWGRRPRDKLQCNREKPAPGRVGA